MEYVFTYHRKNQEERAADHRKVMPRLGVFVPNEDMRRKEGGQGKDKHHGRRRAGTTARVPKERQEPSQQLVTRELQGFLKRGQRFVAVLPNVWWSWKHWYLQRK